MKTLGRDFPALGLNQLQQVEILEIAKCNLIKIPPSLEELWPQCEHSIPRIGPSHDEKWLDQGTLCSCVIAWLFSSDLWMQRQTPFHPVSLRDCQARLEGLMILTLSYNNIRAFAERWIHWELWDASKGQYGNLQNRLCRSVATALKLEAWGMSDMYVRFKMI